MGVKVMIECECCGGSGKEEVTEYISKNLMTIKCRACEGHGCYECEA